MVIKSGLSISLLMTMIEAMGINLFDIYLQQLPPDVQPTNRERKLEQQLAALQKEYDDLKKEKDMLERMVAILPPQFIKSCQRFLLHLQSTRGESEHSHAAA